MSPEDWQSHDQRAYALLNRLHGTGESGMSRLFDREDGTAPLTMVPFPRQARTSNRLAYFNQGAIEHAVSAKDLELIDPRTLMAGQSHITHAGVRYYLDGDYARTGATYADQHKPGNRFPVVYEARSPFGHMERTLLGGHHRATSALLLGQGLPSIVVRSPYLR